MDFEPESWDVSKEASDLNSSLFSSSPAKGKHKKLTEEADKSRFREETCLNIEERGKTSEVGRLDCSSVRDLKKKNKRNKYLGFDKSNKDTQRNVEISESTDFLNRKEKVFSNIVESNVKNSDDSRVLSKTSHLVENIHSKFNLKRQKLSEQSGQKSSFSNTFAAKSKRDFYESGPRTKKTKLFENESEDDLSIEHVADKFVEGNNGILSSQRHSSVGLKNRNEISVVKKKWKQQRNETATSLKIEEHATNFSLLKDNNKSDTTASLTHSEHSTNESIPLLDKSQHGDSESSCKRKRKKGLSKNINHAVNDQELHGPSLDKKTKLIDTESNISENNRYDIQEKKNGTKEKKRKRKCRKNKFKTSDTPAADSSQSTGQGNIESRKRELDSSLSQFKDESRRNESISSKTEMTDELRNVGNCENMHEIRKEINIMHRRGDKSMNDDTSNPSNKEDQMQTSSMEYKAKKIKQDHITAEKEKQRNLPARISDRVSLTFTPEKISEILAKTKKYSELKITDKLENTDVGNKKQTAITNRYSIESPAIKKKQSEICSVTNVEALTNNRFTEKQGSNELQGSANEMKKKSLLQVNRERLEAARFRFINEQLYSRTGAEAFELFKDDPEAFEVYHKGFQNQVDKWPVNPLDVIIDFVKSKPVSKVVVDFGCGDAKLAQSVPHKVHSFDLVALNKQVTVCDIADVPLPNAAVDIAVFCLSLMGTNFSTYLMEANRVLKNGGFLVIAEVASRFVKVKDFVIKVEKLGFQSIEQDTGSKMFVLMKFQKKSDVKNKVSVNQIRLKPCVYKKR